MSKNNKTCLFSAISGTITLSGKPVANARIKRVSDERIDESKTDENGYFTMPSIFANPIFSFISRLIPGQFVSPQKLYVYVGGMEHQILDAVRRREKELSESLGKPWVVTCELTDEPEVFRIDGNAFYTMCKWDAEHDQKRKVMPPS